MNFNGQYYREPGVITRFHPIQIGLKTHKVTLENTSVLFRMTTKLLSPIYFDGVPTVAHTLP